MENYFYWYCNKKAISTEIFLREIILIENYLN